MGSLEEPIRGNDMRLELSEAIEDWGKQYGMQDTYGCFILFDNKLSNIVEPNSDKLLKDCLDLYNARRETYLAGSTQGSIVKQRFVVEDSVFDTHHQDWFFGGASREAIEIFLSYVFHYFGLVGKGKAIIVDRQTGETDITSDGQTYKSINGIERFLKLHHQTDGKGGYIYYTYVVDNLQPKEGEGYLTKLYNLYVKIRNWLLTTIGKKFNGLKFYKISKQNQIERITQDDGLMGRFLNDNGGVDIALSILVSVPDATSEQLLMIGTDICNSFHQTSVVIEDLNKNICYFANGKKFSGKNYDERKANASRNLDEFEPFLNKSVEERPNGDPNPDIGTVNESEEEAINELLRLAGC